MNFEEIWKEQSKNYPKEMRGFSYILVQIGLPNIFWKEMSNFQDPAGYISQVVYTEMIGAMVDSTKGVFKPQPKSFFRKLFEAVLGKKIVAKLVSKRRRKLVTGKSKNSYREMRGRLVAALEGKDIIDMLLVRKYMSEKREKEFENLSTEKLVEEEKKMQKQISEEIVKRFSFIKKFVQDEYGSKKTK